MTVEDMTTGPETTRRHTSPSGVNHDPCTGRLVSPVPVGAVMVGDILADAMLRVIRG